MRSAAARGVDADWRPNASQAHAIRLALHRVTVVGPDAEDCAQEALIAVWLAGEAGADQRMHSVARRAVVDTLRRVHGRIGTARSAGRAVTEPWSPHHHAGLSLDTPEAMLDLAQRLESLTSRQREAIEADMEHDSRELAGATLGISGDGLGYLLNRARVTILG